MKKQINLGSAIVLDPVLLKVGTQFFLEGQLMVVQSIQEEKVIIRHASNLEQIWYGFRDRILLIIFVLAIIIVSIGYCLKKF